MEKINTRKKQQHLVKQKLPPLLSSKVSNKDKVKTKLTHKDHQREHEEQKFTGSLSIEPDKVQQRHDIMISEPSHLSVLTSSLRYEQIESLINLDFVDIYFKDFDEIFTDIS